MGSPLGLTWTNACLVYVEINWLQNYLMLSLITTGCMLMISLFYSPHQNI